jgi:integrase
MKSKPKGAKYRNLNRHGGVIYYDRTVKGRRISFSTRTSDWNEAAAVRDLYEERRGVGTGIAPPREAPRFSDFSQRYLTESMGHLAPSTQDDRRAMLGPESGLTRSFGKLRLDQITRASLMEWWTVEMEGCGRARSTVNNHLNALSGVLAYAVDLDEIEANPVDMFRGILRRRRRTKRGRADTERLDQRHPIEDLGALGAFVKASASIGGDHHLATMLMLDAGLRIGEAEALRWEHVEAGATPTDPGRALVVTASCARGRYDGATKSGRSRRVALSQRLRALLLERRMLQGRPERSATVFERFSRKLYRRHFDGACHAAGLAGLTPKALHDTFASQLLTAGVSPGYVALQLGHEDDKTTGKHYAKWVESDRYREPVALLDSEVPADLLARMVTEIHNDSHNGKGEGIAG